LAPSAVNAWAAHFGWLKVPSPLSWIGTTTAEVIFTIFALVELVTDNAKDSEPHRAAGIDCSDLAGWIDWPVRRFGRG
jgi:uncharacterized membrane protein